MTHSMVKTPLVAFFITLVRISDGHIIANFQPHENSIDPQLQIADLTYQLEKLKQQHNDAQSNFEEHQLDSRKEAEDLRKEIDQLSLKLRETTHRKNRLVAANEKKKQGYELLLQVAEDEQFLYDTTLQQCSSGKNPTSFGTVLYPQEPQERRPRAVVMSTEMPTLIPGVRRVPEVGITVRPTSPPTTTPFESETMQPPLLEGVWHNPTRKAEAQCGSVMRDIKQSNETLQRVQNDREEKIKKLGVVTKEIARISALIDKASDLRYNLLGNKPTTGVHAQQDVTGEVRSNKKARNPK